MVLEKTLEESLELQDQTSQKLCCLLEIEVNQVRFDV